MEIVVPITVLLIATETIYLHCASDADRPILLKLDRPMLGGQWPPQCCSNIREAPINFVLMSPQNVHCSWSRVTYHPLTKASTREAQEGCAKNLGQLNLKYNN